MRFVAFLKNQLVRPRLRLCFQLTAQMEERLFCQLMSSLFCVQNYGLSRHVAKGGSEDADEPPFFSDQKKKIDGVRVWQLRVQVPAPPRCRPAYLIVTIICEYKILRFWEWDDFAGTNFCDFMKSS